MRTWSLKFKVFFQASGKAPSIPYLFGYFLKTMLQIVFQMSCVFMMLWMTLFHNRWQNFRDFIIRNYSEDSLNYLCGFFIFFALIVITFGRGCKFFEISLFQERDKKNLSQFRTFLYACWWIFKRSLLHIISWNIFEMSGKNFLDFLNFILPCFQLPKILCFKNLEKEGIFSLWFWFLWRIS